MATTSEVVRTRPPPSAANAPVAAKSKALVTIAGRLIPTVAFLRARPAGGAAERPAFAHLRAAPALPPSEGTNWAADDRPRYIRSAIVRGYTPENKTYGGNDHGSSQIQSRYRAPGFRRLLRDGSHGEWSVARGRRRRTRLNRFSRKHERVLGRHALLLELRQWPGLAREARRNASERVYQVRLERLGLGARRSRGRQVKHALCVLGRPFRRRHKNSRRDRDVAQTVRPQNRRAEGKHRHAVDSDIVQ